MHLKVYRQGDISQVMEEEKVYFLLPCAWGPIFLNSQLRSKLTALAWICFSLCWVDHICLEGRTGNWHCVSWVHVCMYTLQAYTYFCSCYATVWLWDMTRSHLETVDLRTLMMRAFHMVVATSVVSLMLWDVSEVQKQRSLPSWTSSPPFFAVTSSDPSSLHFLGLGPLSFPQSIFPRVHEPHSVCCPPLEHLSWLATGSQSLSDYPTLDWTQRQPRWSGVETCPSLPPTTQNLWAQP